MNKFLILFTLICSSCFTNKKSIYDPNKKLNIHISDLDENGVKTSGVLLNYEFCIPNTPLLIQKIKNIDNTIFISNGKGRSNCSKKEILCIGETNKNYITVFNNLIKINEIKQINESYFE